MPVIPGRHFLASALIAVSVILACRIPPASAAGITYAPPGPTGSTQVSRPTLAWKVWPKDEGAVTAVAMQLNGTTVPASYSSTQRSVVYTPTRPLSPGLYRVKCTVTIDNWWPVNQEWSFSIPEAVRTAMPAPDPGVRQALQMANAYRSTMGLPPFHLDERLCAAASAHSHYLALHRITGHYESPGSTGFVGHEPWDRAGAFGYGDICSEDVSWGTESPGLAVQGLLDAPYHRFPFMQPGAPDFGAGFSGRSATLEFGPAAEEGVVVYPVDREVNVPVSWMGQESPDPLQAHGISGPVGYILTVGYYAANDRKLISGEASLTCEGQSVPVYVNTPANDPDLTNGMLIILRSPLRPGTEYTADANFTTAAGRRIHKEWSFTTSDRRVHNAR